MGRGLGYGLHHLPVVCFCHTGNFDFQFNRVIAKLPPEYLTQGVEKVPEIRMGIGGLDADRQFLSFMFIMECDFKRTESVTGDPIDKR